MEDEGLPSVRVERVYKHGMEGRGLIPGNTRVRLFLIHRGGRGAAPAAGAAVPKGPRARAWSAVSAVGCMRSHEVTALCSVWFSWDSLYSREAVRPEPGWMEARLR